jgi:thiol-disulfide isomerase/thioredoxin
VRRSFQLSAFSSPRGAAVLAALFFASAAAAAPEAPRLAGELDAKGYAAAVAKQKGQVVLVNFWATWCVPCREEMPSMQTLYDSLADRGFRIAAISIDEGGPEDVVAFAQQLGLTFDILHDRSGTVERLYQTTGVPESFLLDRRGILVKRVIGAHDWSSPANRSTVERLLAQPES